MTENRFEDPIFEAYAFEDIPLGRDLVMVDEKQIDYWEDCVLNHGAQGTEKIPVYRVSAEAVHADSVELRWFINAFDRFHAISIHLPRDKFRACAGSINWDEPIHIFADSAWLKHLLDRRYAVFGMVDAIGAKQALRSGAVTRPKLESLRSGIDQIAAFYPEIAFISFGDSVLLKSNWSVEYVRKGYPKTYRPEQMVEIYETLSALYVKELGLKAYGIFTQGANEFYADDLLYLSSTKNHVGLNSVGAPFAQLIEIEGAVKKAIKDKSHPPADLYFDGHLFASLNFKSYDDKEKIPRASYSSKVIASECQYRYIESAAVLSPMLSTS